MTATTVGHDSHGAGPGRPLPQRVPGGRAAQVDPQMTVLGFNA